MMFDNFYKNKRVFLTGHTGFKGAWLALWLHYMGAEVGAYSLEPPSEPSLWGLSGVEQNVIRLGGDIRDPNKLAEAVAEFQPEIVIHMAAQSLVRPSYETPADTFATNVMGTVHVLDAVRKADCVKAVINVTSDKCYENKEWIWGYRESDPMGGHDPYSASKGCSELVAASYMKSYFSDGNTAVASVRAGNVIGGGDFALDRLVPDMVRAFSVDDVVHIRSPHAIRPWQHVLEPLYGYLMLAMKLVQEQQAFSGGWNFGPSDESARSVGEVVERFAQLWGDNARHKLDKDNHPHEATWLKLDCSKSNRLLEWKPKTNFSQALDLTMQWYKGWNGGHDTKALTFEQIAYFEAL